VQIGTWCYYQGEEESSIIKSWRKEGHPVNGNTESCRMVNQVSLDIWESVFRVPSTARKCEHCLSAVEKALSFSDCVLVTLNVNDDDDVLRGICLGDDFECHTVLRVTL